MNFQKILRKSDATDTQDLGVEETPINTSGQTREKIGAIIYDAVNADTDTAFVVVDRDENILYLSPNYAALMGLSEDAVSAVKTHEDLSDIMRPLVFFGDGDPEALSKDKQTRTRQKLLSASDFKNEWRIEMKDGRTLKATSRFTTSGHMVTNIFDATEDTDSVQLLKLGMLMGTSGYWAYNFAAQKTEYSQYIADTLNADELEIIRKQGLLALVHKDDLESASMMFLECKSNRTRMNGDFRIVTQKGVRWIRTIGEFQYLDKTDEPYRFVAFINDITADIEHMKELSDAQDLSRAKSDFLARMSHEIKTPLNAIVGLTDALMDEVDNEESRETARYIADAAQNLDSVLSQTLEHARLSSKEMILDIDQHDPRALVRSTAALFKKQCKDKGLALNVRISETAPNSVSTDTTRLRQCLTNLLSNAVKFTDKGQIDVALAGVRRPSGEQAFIMAVKDTGIGMSETAATNIFKPFAQADETIGRRFGGSGLGMAITRQIVEAMNGDIRVKSKQGEGTTILISMPVNQPAAEQRLKPVPDPAASPADESAASIQQTQRPSPSTTLPPSAAPAAISETEQAIAHSDAQTPAPAFAKISKNVTINPTAYSGFDVLVVEDNPINQKVVGKLLAGHVRSVTFAFHGDEALKILRQQNFDVILMDIHMPIKDGIETTLEIRNSGEPWADVVIVALTADPDYQQKRICRNIGMDDTIAKPVRRQDLLDAMERVLRDRGHRKSGAA